MAKKAAPRNAGGTHMMGSKRGSADKMHKVMGEYKAGTLKSSSGAKVKSRKQAIAIGLSEARAAGQKVAPKKRKEKK